MTLPSDHTPVAVGRVGLLLVNLGTPDDLSVPSVRRYLKEFLWDKRVVEIPRPVWWLLLNGIILNTRPKKSAAAYAKIWRTEDNESPLRYYTRMQAEKLAPQLPDVVVDYAMRYGNPSIRSRLDVLKQQGCDRIVIMPLYPQYSATTTASVNDEVFAALKVMRWQPSIRITHPWYRHPAYIEALASQVRDYMASASSPPQRILLSFHGLPKLNLTKGDPYYCQCMVTGRLLREALGNTAPEITVTFQSRFGPAKWLEPYTVDTLRSLPAQGVKNLLILTPGFVTDCLETLEEIAIEGADEFKAAGGEHCSVLPCLNDSEQSIELIKTLAEIDLAGWT